MYLANAAIWSAVFRRAGYRHFIALGFVMLVPVVNFGWVLWFRCRGWPIEREVHMLRMALNKGSDADNQSLVSLWSGDQDLLRINWRVR